MGKRSSIPCKYLKVTPGTSRERGHLWVPSEKTMVDNDPFRRKFKIVKSDKLFIEIDTRFTQSSLKRKTIEKDISFLSHFKEFHESRRSRHSGFAAITIPHPSGSCRTILRGNNSTFCVTRKLY